MSKPIDITSAVWEIVKLALMNAQRYEGQSTGGGTLFRPDLPLTPSELLEEAIKTVVDRQRIPMSVDDEIAYDFGLDERGDRIRTMRILIREREGDY